MNNIPLIARKSFSCPCGTRIEKGRSYMVVDDKPVCMGCALPVKERRLRLIGIRERV
jgi:hypothetical protein